MIAPAPPKNAAANPKSTFRELFGIAGGALRRRVACLLALSVLGAVAELFTVGAIVPLLGQDSSSIANAARRAADSAADAFERQYVNDAKVAAYFGSATAASDAPTVFQERSEGDHDALHTRQRVPGSNAHVLIERAVGRLLHRRDVDLQLQRCQKYNNLITQLK